MRWTYIERECDGEDDAEEEHSSQTAEMQRPPSRPVHQRYRHNRHHHHDTSHSERRVFSGVFIQTDFGEEVCWVVKDLKQYTTNLSSTNYSYSWQ